jgi:aromatic ring-opening dioxygenase catalytic subunit (LigB family)
MSAMSTRFPTFYLSHGGGPWPYMTGGVRQNFAALESSLKELPRQLDEKPRAILMISGHWEETDFAVMSNPQPPMVYDFGGFPEETYHIRYPAPGSPELARRVRALIEKAGLASHLDPARGFDHGTYSLLAVTHPNADVPVVQVSIRSDYDPEAHLQLGRALAAVRDEGVLIIGSGSSYHNLRAMMVARRNIRVKDESAQFDSWLCESLVNSAPRQRSQRLLEWQRAPHARAVHPRADHLMPLHVAVGAAEEEPGQVIYWQGDFFGNITASSYRFGAWASNGNAGHDAT